MVEHTKLASQCLPWGVLHSWDLKEQTVGLSVLAIGTMVDQTVGLSVLAKRVFSMQCPIRLSMWWDGVWAGCRLDSGVCPIYKHTELDDIGDVNEVKVLPKRMPPRRQPTPVPTPQTSAPHSSTPSPANSPPPPPPPLNPPPNLNAPPVLDPATMIDRIQGHGNNSGHTTGEASGNTCNTSDCSYKSFIGCKPPSFSGVEGAVGLIQWLEKMETTLDISGCPEHHKIHYAAGSFSKRALTWWNSQIQARGREEALVMPWADFKILLRNEFCPKHELQKLEVELSNHVTKGADHMTFTTRYHELVALVPEMVPTLEKRIDLYVGGLPSCIHGIVLVANPATLESAISLSAKLTDVMVKSGVLKKDTGKAQEEPTGNPEHHQKKKQKVVKIM
ncbi:hypothetical protein E3N88_25539 [Mikania micrantha]|uniref:Ty3 transposon capsid-like protein domain-containing protein n=1 Tax=Mikania micrantha TaxID=192012 RepID=A0A5N6N7T7_9ASTR|nr:hypothetical protein E3N88_25539 [Mikania micrantha]